MSCSATYIWWCGGCCADVTRPGTSATKAAPWACHIPRPLPQQSHCKEPGCISCSCLSYHRSLIHPSSCMPHPSPQLEGGGRGGASPRDIVARGKFSARLKTPTAQSATCPNDCTKTHKACTTKRLPNCNSMLQHGEKEKDHHRCWYTVGA